MENRNLYRGPSRLTFAIALLVLALLGSIAHSWRTQGQREGSSQSLRVAASAAHHRPRVLAAGLLGASLVGLDTGNAFNGVADFPTPGTYSFTVPSGVASIQMWLYGAGGGGSQSSANRGGGTGGSGALAVSVVAVTAGDTYTISVGAGGAGGFNRHGFDGGATTLVDPNGNVILGAGGGGGGAVTGQPGQGGMLTGNPMIGRPGFAAGFGSGYQPPTLIDPGSFGVVSAGGLGSHSPSAPGPGENGYAFIAY
jgi:Glycine-rich domain